VNVPNDISAPKGGRASASNSIGGSRVTEVFQPDPIWRSLGIFGYSGEPEILLADLQEMIAAARLSERVPEDVRRQFEGVCKHFLHGFFEYDFFWVAAGRAYLIAESALRHRFLEYYGHQIPFISRDGLKTDVLTVGNFESLWQLLRDRRRRREWLLESKHSDRPHRQFDGSLAALLRWAFDEQLLPGRRATWIARVFAGFRNMAGHPSYGCQPPAEPAWQICDVAELINCLWGERTAGGRLFPIPRLVHRVPVAIIRDFESGSVSFGTAERFADWDDVNDRAGVTLVLASIGDDIANFRHGFESTRCPSTAIWGPGSRKDALAYLALNPVSEDDVAYVDRLFLVRTGRDMRAKVGPFDWPVEGVELPRSTDAALALPARKQSGNWYVIRADYPDDAFEHVIQRRRSGAQHKIRRAPRCLCGVDELAAAVTWEKAMAPLADAQSG
jgi:hypothetical protein